MSTHITHGRGCGRMLMCKHAACEADEQHQHPPGASMVFGPAVDGMLAPWSCARIQISQASFGPESLVDASWACA